MNREFGDGTQILAVGFYRRRERQPIGAGHRSMSTVLEPPDPGYDRTVLTPDHQLHSQLDSAVLALDQTDEIGAAVAPAHAVDQGDGAIRCFEPGLQDQRALAIAAGNSGMVLRDDLPTPILRVAQQSRKAGCRIKARQGKPVDRTVAAHQRRALAIADYRVVLDEPRHVTPAPTIFSRSDN